MAVFNRLGEPFSPTRRIRRITGFGLSENFIVKHDKRYDRGNSDASGVSQEHSRSVGATEGMYDKIVVKFASFRTAQAQRSDEQLQNKLSQIDSIIRSQTTQQVVTSSMTNNLDTIIENMRACLACKATGTGQNNDTNLSFGDPNKFYVYTRRKISWEVLWTKYFCRACRICRWGNRCQDGFDTIYGTKRHRFYLIKLLWQIRIALFV